jgi:hypothetical protein
MVNRLIILRRHRAHFSLARNVAFLSTFLALVGQRQSL